MLNDNPVLDACLDEFAKRIFQPQKRNKTNPAELNERKREVDYYRDLEKSYDDLYGF